MTAIGDGLLLIDKPSGPTSHDIVDRARRGSGRRRIGHAGTLDPLASGLLPLVVGAATRLVRFLPAAPKTYEGACLLGRRTTTDDVTGDLLAEHGAPPPSAAEVLDAAAGLVGRIRQTPPAVSARKVGGERLYRLARRGLAVEAPAVEVEVRRFELTPGDRPDSWRFVAVVSSGTYIRSLCRDLGERLGCGGVLSELRRTAIGPMSLEAALPASALAEAPLLAAALIPPAEMPLLPPPLTLDDPADVRRFTSGNPVEGGAAGAGNLPDGHCRVLESSGRLLGIAEKRGESLRPRVVLA